MTTTQEAGKMGVQKRNENLGPEGRSRASQKAAQTAKERYGSDFHQRIGAAGGKTSHGKRKAESDEDEHD